MIDVCGLTDQGKIRQTNQDDYRVSTFGETAALCAVCDGMGGANAGDIASHLALDTFWSAVLAHPTQSWGQDTEAMLSAAITQANTAVFDRSIQEHGCAGMGTTIAAALILGECAHILNIGDSRVYLIRAGQIALTRDHSLVQDLLERGELTPEQARQHPQRNLITRALGVEGTVQADFFQQTLCPGDRLLLCSDGLFTVLSDEEICREICAGSALDAICRSLVDRTLAGGAPDNVTVTLAAL